MPVLTSPRPTPFLTPATHSAIVLSGRKWGSIATTRRIIVVTLWYGYREEVLRTPSAFLNDTRVMCATSMNSACQITAPGASVFEDTRNYRLIHWLLKTICNTE